MSHPKEHAQDLFGSPIPEEQKEKEIIEDDIPHSAFEPKEILLATNTENLKTMISSGLIHSMEGYSKYYRDLSHFSPGLIPLFIDRVPASILPECKEESGIDLAILSLKLSWSDVSGHVDFHIDDQNRLITSALHPTESAKVIFFRGGIPLSALKAIFVESSEAKHRFLAYRYSNFIPELFSIKVQPKKFTQLKGESALASMITSLSERSKLPPDRPHSPSSKPFLDADFLKSDACGGLIFVLIQRLPPVAESGKLLSYILQPPPVDYLKLSLLPKSLKFLNNWLWNNPVKTEDIDAILLWHLLHLLTEIDPLQGLTSTVFLAALKKRFEQSDDLRSAPSTPYEALKQRLFLRFDDIQNALDQHIDPSDFFNDPQLHSDMMRALLLFLLRTKSVWSRYDDEDLLQEWSITAEVMLFAGILCGVWQGWRFLDEEIRPQEKNRLLAVSSCMANRFNRPPMDRETALTFDAKGLTVNGRCQLWEKKILKHIPWGMKSKLGQFARNLAKERNWPALQSKLVIPGENLTQVSYQQNGNLTVTMNGDVTLTESIDKPLFFELLDEIQLSSKELRQLASYLK